MNQKIKWIVAISNTYDYSITLLHLTATIEEAKRYLLNSIEEEKEMSYEMCTRSTENIDEISVNLHHKSKSITELSAHACFETYSVEYSAQTVDMIQDVTDIDLI